MDFNQILSQSLSYLILLGSIALKLPQIINILKSGTVEGLSAVAIYGEVPLSIVSIAYNYLQGNPFTSYGESVFILIQNLIIVLLLWAYSKPRPSASTMLGLSAFFAGSAILSINLPENLQFILPLLTLPLQLTSGLSQIIQNFKNKSTGQLSIITVLLTFAGSCIRLFTTIDQVGYDLSLLSVLLVSVSLSGTLLAQILFMGSTKPATKKKD